MTVRILIGDCRDVLRTLPDESVHCVVTSPPYFGLRDYGTAKWEGGDEACDHVERQPGRGSSTLASAGIGQTDEGSAYLAQKRQFRSTCGKCGARRIDSQIGLEPTPDAYVAELVAVFREVRRVLRKDGTLFLNLGDSYNGSGPSGWPGLSYTNVGSQDTTVKRVPGLKPKDLIGIPWMVAFALRADGWWLRQDIIWSKPNPMPESVTDRCTKAHEYLFLMAKSERYYFDAAAIAEPVTASTVERLSQPTLATQAGSDRVPGKTNGRMKAVRGKALTTPRNDGNTWNENNGRGFMPTSDKRNRRSVWTVTTPHFSAAHFATFPPALIEPCIKAGCPAGGTVLDPFAGAGTTGLVADRLGRDAVLIELNPEYATLGHRRIWDDSTLFSDVALEERDAP